jgi:hypothetical protein
MMRILLLAMRSTKQAERFSFAARDKTAQYR